MLCCCHVSNSYFFYFSNIGLTFTPTLPIHRKHLLNSYILEITIISWWVHWLISSVLKKNVITPETKMKRESASLTHKRVVCYFPEPPPTGLGPPVLTWTAPLLPAIQLSPHKHSSLLSCGKYTSSWLFAFFLSEFTPQFWWNPSSNSFLFIPFFVYL